MSQITVDKICLEAQGLQHLIETAKAVDPSFANALLGSVYSSGKTSLGTIVIGGLTIVSARYGFGWTSDTTAIISGILLLGINWLLQHGQVWRYRRRLSLTTNIQSPQAQPSPPTT